MKYWLSPKISWKVFKKLNAPFQYSIVPKQMDKILWQLLRDRYINMYFSNAQKDRNDQMIITIKAIKGGKISNSLEKK